MSVEIPARASLSLHDVVSTLFLAEGNGAIRIASSDSLVVASRTSNTTDGGTYGQYIPGVPVSEVTRPGDAALLTGLERSNAFRTNLGLASASATSASALVELYDADGGQLSTLAVDLPPYGFVQITDIFTVQGHPQVADGFAVVRNTSADASFVAYASVVDERTGDPIAVLSTGPSRPGVPLWIAAAAHDTGVGGTVWRTDLELVNTGAADVEASVALLLGGRDNSNPATTQVAVAAGRAVRVGDAVSELFDATGSGALRVSAASNDLTVTSRTFNLTPEGTYGQYIPGVTAARAIGGGETGALAQLRRSASFRTNVGLVNLTSTPITVDVAYHAADGGELGRADYELEPFGLPPGQWRHPRHGRGRRGLRTAVEPRPRRGLPGLRLGGGQRHRRPGVRAGHGDRITGCVPPRSRSRARRRRLGSGPASWAGACYVLLAGGGRHARRALEPAPHRLPRPSRPRHSWPARRRLRPRRVGPAGGRTAAGGADLAEHAPRGRAGDDRPRSRHPCSPVALRRDAVRAGGGRPRHLHLPGRGPLQPARCASQRPEGELHPPVDEKGVVLVSDDLEGAVVWGLDLPVVRAGKPARGTAPLPEWAAKTLERSFFPPPSHHLAVARFGGSPGMVYALLDGRKEELLLSVDPQATLERLARVDKLPMDFRPYGSYRYLETLAVQPIGRPWWQHPQPPLVATHHSIQVDNSEGEEVSVATTTRLQATRAGIGLWRVDLLSARVKDEKELPIEVTSVTVRGKPAPYLHRRDELLVRLDPPPSAGETLEVTVANHGRMALRPGGDNYWTLGTWAWYPQPGWDAEVATVDLEVRVPEPFQPFASGETVSQVTENGFTRLTSRLEQPMQFPVVAAGKYRVVEETRDGVTCRVAAYAIAKEDACRRLVNNFFAAVEFYQQVFGVPFPFKEMDIIEINSWGFGQAPPGVIFITQEAYTPLANTLNRIFSQGVNERFVHEIAHSWWGHVVKMSSPEEVWLSESFSEYAAALCLQAAKGGGRKGNKEFDELLKGWRVGAREVGDGGSVFLASHLAGHDESDELDRVYLHYNKGALVLHALRTELAAKHGEEQGDRLFFALLRALQKNFTFKPSATRHVVGILNQITGTDWQPWFERYVYGCEMPGEQ